MVAALLLTVTGQIINSLYAILITWVSIAFMGILSDYKKNKKKGKPSYHLTALRNSIIAIDGILAILLFIVGLSFAVRLTMSNERKLEYDTYSFFRNLRGNPEKLNEDGGVYIKVDGVYKPMWGSMLDTLGNDFTLAYRSDEKIISSVTKEQGIENPVYADEAVIFERKNGKVNSFITVRVKYRDNNIPKEQRYDYLYVDGKAIQLKMAKEEEKNSFAMKELRDLKKRVSMY